MAATETAINSLALNNFEENAEKSSNFEENHPIQYNVGDLPECPVCYEEIKIVPTFECTNGHVICSNCIPKLDKCPICRNNSMPVRSSKSEEIILEVIGLLSEDMPEKPQILRWGLESRLNAESNEVQINMETNVSTIASSIRIEIEDRRYVSTQNVEQLSSRANIILKIIAIIVILILLGMLCAEPS